METNRGRKNDLSFDQWLNAPDNVNDRPGFVKRHLIPDDPRLYLVENFDEFLTERAKLIAKKLQAEFQR